MVLLAAAAAVAAVLADRPGGEFAEAAPPVDAVPDAPGERNLLLQTLYRNRSIERDLTRAEREFADGHVLEGLRYLQSVWDREEDSFLWSERERGLSSARLQAARIMRAQGGEVWKTYERMSGATAKQMLVDADASLASDDYAEVVRRFYFTAAGLEAADRLAMRAMDRGEPRRAVRLWRTLIDEPAHRSRVSPGMIHKMTVAARLAQDDEAALAAQNAWAERFSGIAPPELPNGLTNPRRGRNATVAVEWLSAPGGDRAVASTTPLLEPVWTVGWSDRPLANGPPIDLAKWEEEQRGKLQPTATSIGCLVVGGRVVFRDFDGVRAVSLETGRTVWRHRSAASLVRPLDGIPETLVETAGATIDAGFSFAENSVTGTLTSDGERVFAVDLRDVTSPRLNPRTRGGANPIELDPRGRRTSNYLVALNVSGIGTGADALLKPDWRVGGPVDSEMPGKSPLEGHFFLGPPRAVEGRLYAVSECDRQLYLVALRAATGEPLWTQGLGYVDRPIEIDQQRSSQACTPTFAEGTIVCNTESGYAVAVDADAGGLLWATPCADDRAGADVRRQRFQTSRAPLGHGGFVSSPHIVGQRVVLLPHASQWVHCLDLRTGDVLWTSDRRTQDGEFIATVTESTVVVVGRRSVRGLSTKDGVERWSLSPGMPSGTGWRSGDRYHLPLQEGRVVVIDVERGQILGLSFTQSAAASGSDDEPPRGALPGNLAAAGDWIISTAPTGVTAYRSSSWLLHQALAELKSRPNDGAAMLRAAELQLLQGEFGRARTSLDAALGTPLDEVRRGRGERMLRELLYADLKAGAPRPEDVLARIDALSHGPDDRGRFLIQRAEFELQRRDFEAVLSTAREFAALEIDEPLPHQGNPSHLVSATSWVPTLIGRAQRQFGPDELARVNRRVAEQLEETLNSQGTEPLQQFLAVYGQWPQADAVRLELADRLTAEGRFQRAELLLLECRGSAAGDVADKSGLRLVALWDRLGLHHESAALFTELRERPAGDADALRADAADWLATSPPRSLFRSALRQLEPVEPGERPVRIREDRLALAAAEVEDTFTGYRRRFLTPPECSFHLLDKGSATDSRVAVVSRDTGTIVGHIALPARNSYPPSAKAAHVGHFFPLGSDSLAQGISLLELGEERPLWTTALSRLPAKDIVRVGPAGPTYCVFQAKQYLAALDPGDGRVLWERTDSDPNSGLIIDPYAGMFGDGEALVVFAADRMSYTVYRTATGEEIRRGRLDVDISLARRAFGRRLLYTSSGNPDRRLILWDPLDDRAVFSEPAEDRIHWTHTPDETQVVMILPPNRLRIIDVRTGEVVVSRVLPDEDVANLSYVRAFRDRDGVYVNFQREVRALTGSQFSYYASDTFLPAAHVQGDLYAFDARTGALLWKRSLPQRTFLQLPDHRLPFLVSFSRVRDRFNGSRQSLLVECIDRRTGETSALRDNIFPDRLVVMNYDAERRRLELIGVKTVIGIEFGEGVLRVPDADAPL